jgi:O-succinylbenzoic acid--CoA ligase
MVHHAFQIQHKGNNYTLSQFLHKYPQSDLGEFMLEMINEKDYVVANTSGTTGAPKAINLKKASIKNSSIATLRFLNLQVGDSALLCLDARYIAGKMMVSRSLIGGLKLIVAETSSTPMKGINGNFDFAAMVPLQAEKSLSDLFRIKKLIIGGGEIHPHLWRHLADIPTDIYQTYGSTETVSHVAMRRIQGAESSVPYKAIGETWFEVDEESRLIIHAPKIHNQAIKTNDIAALVDAQTFFWKGRSDNVINSGGVKIFPEEIEQHLSGYLPGDFAVLGVPDPSLGTRAILASKEALTYVQMNLLKNRLQELHPFKRPKQLYINAFWPKTETGKLKRLLLTRELLNDANAIEL